MNRDPLRGTEIIDPAAAGRIIAQAMYSELEKIAVAAAASAGIRGVGRKMMQLGAEMVGKAGAKAGEKGLERTGKGLGSFLGFHGGQALRSTGRYVRKHPKKAVGIGAAGLVGTGVAGGAALS